VLPWVVLYLRFADVCTHPSLPFVAQFVCAHAFTVETAHPTMNSYILNTANSVLSMTWYDESYKYYELILQSVLLY
jgi:ferritin